MDTVGSVAFDRNRVCASTITTADHFQHYIPLYCYCLKKAYPDFRISVGIIGEMDDITEEAMAMMAKDGTIAITKNIFKGPILESTPNMLRFLLIPKCEEYDAVIITDVDLLLFKTNPSITQWHTQRMLEMDTCYAGHHGPWKKPRRFPGGWRNDKERIAGGFVFVTPEWFERTKIARIKYYDQIEEGVIGDYREADEVMLCNIVKESGLPVPESKNFDVNIRGIHLGDFKSTMDHRWKNTEKMRGKLTDQTIYKYEELCCDETFVKIRDICCMDPEIESVFDNLHEHIGARSGKVR